MTATAKALEKALLPHLQDLSRKPEAQNESVGGRD
jgi:hypothetical protein